MVYYFTSTAVDPAAPIYVGKHAGENEGLIAHGWEDDFHVDNLSSAHVYLRLREDVDWRAIPRDLLIDCAQLTKANSIEGNKKDNVTVIYTPWSNLRKDGSMKEGQVSFHDSMAVKKILVEKRENAIVNRLNKTRVERFPDLRQEKEDRAKELRQRAREAEKSAQKEALRIAKERAQAKHQKEHMYDDVHDEEAVHRSSNQDRDEDFLDDFM